MVFIWPPTSRRERIQNQDIVLNEALSGGGPMVKIVCATTVNGFLLIVKCSRQVPVFFFLFRSLAHLIGECLNNNKIKTDNSVMLRCLVKKRVFQLGNEPMSMDRAVSSTVMNFEDTWRKLSEPRISWKQIQMPFRRTSFIGCEYCAHTISARFYLHSSNHYQQLYNFGAWRS